MQPEPEPLELRTADGLRLEAELVVPDDVVAAAVLPHPHPQHGGSMKAVVTGALFAGLPEHGVAALRFNFRGIGWSEGEYDGGRGEQLDVVAAIDALAEITEGLPLVVAGASFGGDVGLAVVDDRISGWFGAAPPLRVLPRDELRAAKDPRPKLLAIPQLDDYLKPDAARAATADWVNTTIEEVAGVGHYFVGRLEVLGPMCATFARSLGM